MKFSFEILRDLQELLSHLSTGMQRLTFSNNFESFETDVTISATSEAEIANSLNFVPSRYIIVSQTGNGLLTKGSSTWTTDNVYIYNNGAVSVTATIIFMR